jgi:predicted SAM-dependent methyltransferase
MRRLHIGGHVRKAGWEVLDANPGLHVDHVSNVTDLSRFQTETFSEVYASHVLEHFDFKDELLAALKEWHRVLMPEGMLHISVPDPGRTGTIVFGSTTAIYRRPLYGHDDDFGGHVDRYDYHVVGLNEEFLRRFLHAAGFATVARVPEFGICHDTSTMKFKGTSISLDVTALKAAS